MNKRDLTLVFGAHDLSNLQRNGVTFGAAKEIILHPDWHTENQNFDADLAAIILDQPVTFSPYIQPICIWDQIHELKTATGVVAGWGKSEDQTKRHENIPKRLRISIWENEHCLLDNPAMSRVGSNRTICGGDKNGASPCLGDSGSGLFVMFEERFYLKGIVSAAEFVGGTCDVSKYSLYTNVGKFTEWIKNPTEFNTRPRPVAPTCGVMSEITSLVQHGELSASKDHWPWVVAMMIRGCKDASNYEFWATGTLITEQHVITTGSSVAYLNSNGSIEALEIDRIRMLFGVNDLQEEVGDFSLQVDGASQIILHPDIKNNQVKTANLAIIAMKERLHFTNFIFPACVGPNDGSSRFRAFAVGYGRDETGEQPSKKKFAALKTRSSKHCSHFFATSKKNQTKFFCIGGHDEEAPCVGDTPLYRKIDDKWYLQGLLSKVVLLPDGLCNASAPALYEDLGQYSEWIVAQSK